MSIRTEIDFCLPSTSRRIAFDIAPYFNKINRPGTRARISSDLAALIIEAGDEPQEERITPYPCVIRGEQLVSLKKGYVGEPLGELFKNHTPTEQMIEFILAHRDRNIVSVWISPANEVAGYPEGRLNVGFRNRLIADKTVINTYGIPIPKGFWLDSEYLLLARNLLDHRGTEEKQVDIESLEQLGETAICFEINPDLDPIDFLAEMIDLPNVWQSIREAKPELQEEEIQQLTDKLVAEYYSSLLGCRSRRDLIIWGAALERQSSYLLGRPILGTNSGCGLLNSDLLSGLTPFTLNRSILDARGNVVSSSSEEGVFCEKCPYCGYSINHTIKEGFRCPSCHNVYKGSCG